MPPWRRWAKTGCEQLQQIASLLDDLVGASEQLRGHVDAENLRGPEIDNQPEFRRLLDRYVSWLGLRLTTICPIPITDGPILSD